MNNLALGINSSLCITRSDTIRVNSLLIYSLRTRDFPRNFRSKHNSITKLIYFYTCISFGKLFLIGQGLKPDPQLKGRHPWAKLPPPCGKKGAGRGFVVRKPPFLAQFEGYRALSTGADLVCDVEDPDASFGARSRARERDPRCEKTRQDAQQREDAPSIQHGSSISHRAGPGKVAWHARTP